MILLYFFLSLWRISSRSHCTTSISIRCCSSPVEIVIYLLFEGRGCFRVTIIRFRGCVSLSFFGLFLLFAFCRFIVVRLTITKWLFGFILLVKALYFFRVSFVVGGGIFPMIRRNLDRRPIFFCCLRGSRFSSWWDVLDLCFQGRFSEIFYLGLWWSWSYNFDLLSHWSWFLHLLCFLIVGWWCA